MACGEWALAGLIYGAAGFATALKQIPPDSRYGIAPRGRSGADRSPTRASSIARAGAPLNRLGAALAIILLFAPAAYADTITQFVPGNAPCDGACDLAWVATEIDIPEGDPVSQTVDPGDEITWMSYAVNGEPRGTSKSMVVATDEPLTGIGYTFERDDIEYLLMKLDACQNWAVFSQSRGVPEPRSGAEAIVRTSALVSEPPFGVASGSGSAGGGLNSAFTAQISFPGTGAPPAPRPEPPQVLANPIPVSSLLLLSALACLGFFQTRTLRLSPAAH